MAPRKFESTANWSDQVVNKLANESRTGGNDFTFDWRTTASRAQPLPAHSSIGEPSAPYGQQYGWRNVLFNSQLR